MTQPTYEAALEQVSGILSQPVKTTVSLDHCPGYVLSEDLVATLAVPRHDLSTVTGWALRSEDCANATAEVPVRLEIIGAAGPGSAWGHPLAPGQAVAVTPATPLPEGADTVLAATAAAEDEQGLPVTAPLTAGINVRRAGEDAAAEDTLLHAGHPLTAGAVAALASQGRADVPVFAKPVVALLSVGDELVDVGAALSGGRSYNAVGPYLRAALQLMGILPLDLGSCDQDPEAVRTQIDQGLCANLLLVAGRLTDPLREALTDADQHPPYEPIIDGLALEPGADLSIGRLGSTVVCWLPSRKADAHVGYQLFVRPMIRQLMGLDDPGPHWVPAILSQPLTNTTQLRHMICAEAEYDDQGRMTVQPLGQDDLVPLAALARAQALVDLPANCGTLDAGAGVTMVLSM